MKLFRDMEGHEVQALIDAYLPDDSDLECTNSNTNDLNA